MNRIRRISTIRDEVLEDRGRRPSEPLIRVAVAAAVGNPWFASSVEDFAADVRKICPPLAQEMMRRGLDALGQPVEAFGKAVVVGLGGETEHGDALVHNPFFSDVVRLGAGGTSVIASTESRGPAGTAVAVPLCHVTAAGTRSHYQGMTVRVADAPEPDEILVVVALSSAARPAARIGDRRTDPPFDPTPWRP
ncbi:amino acid synthesis family protein [Amnibacterium flavum]|uniref:Peptide synthetase n=1 Tax=Amnibacterium flavum TaxID=2173173 RepID=A0A2V1HV58_9MICO|nr:amino acid synthesis family protein [Amnibacterium flavum]PVZ96201.1 peptide synthetase [Amnibacterium flavum]